MFVRATGGVPLTGDMRDAAASCPLSAARRTATQLPSLLRSARRVRRAAACGLRPASGFPPAFTFTLAR